MKEGGQFCIAYRTSAIDRILQVYSGKIEGRFILATEKGDVIYDSKGSYTEEYIPYMETLLSDTENAVIDGIPCYIQTIPMLNRHYIGVHIVPQIEVDKGNNGYSFMIIGIFAAMVLVSGVLYVTAGSLVSHRVKELEKGMKLVGSNNLSYRIPIFNRHDEYEEIAVRFNEMCDELQYIINREFISEIKKKNAELKALQTGINPHFLYNTLEVIRVKAYDNGIFDVAEMIVLIANFYRSVVRENTFITIREEINICSMYLNIFSLRYSDEFEYELDIDPQLMEYGIPKILLQPVIENYFLHGLKDKYEGNRFSIIGRLEGNNIVFTFKDNGRGINKNKLEKIRNQLNSSDSTQSSGYGLLNVNERIKLVYGESCGLWIDSTEKEETCISVCIKAMTCDELNHRYVIPEHRPVYKI